MWNAILVVVGMLYRFWDLAPFGEWVNRSQRAGVGKCWEGIVGACVWIGFRDNFRGYEITEEVTLGFMEGFVSTLGGG